MFKVIIFIPMVFIFRISLVFLFSYVALSLQAESESGWKKVKEKDGVVVYEKEIGDRTAFRGVAILEGTPEKLVGILHNTERWRYWIEDLDEGRELSKLARKRRFL